LRAWFWISAAAIFYTYIGYPLAVWVAGRILSRRVSKADFTPSVSIVIACHNEADCIESRIKNLLESDYPKDLLEIIVVSDGSTDATEELARSFESDRLRALAYPERKGKPSALNLGVHQSSGEIIVFADARQRFEKNAVRELTANFADISVGAVTGELALESDSSVGESVGLYWKYEKWIRRNESLCGSVVGATGAIYAVRRALYKPLPQQTILDDLYTPMQIALGGSRVVMEERAIAHDRATRSAGREFARKVRTLTGNYQLCQLMPRLLLPTNRLLFQFHSHKLMRLAAPLFFVILLASSLAMTMQAGGLEGLFYQSALAAQTMFYLSIPLSGALLGRARGARLLKAAYVFSVMNAAAIVGFFYFLRGKRDVWVK
jgi:cellulose synthase/poly-beta-1,6-N-acetylglucosamine synthase-like glycosyltransferase